MIGSTKRFLKEEARQALVEYTLLVCLALTDIVVLPTQAMPRRTCSVKLIVL
jgi:hypothetical protein